MSLRHRIISHISASVYIILNAHNLYLDFSFKIDKIASFMETSDDLYLASQF